MRVAILDDYCDTLRTLPCFAGLSAHDVTVFTDHSDDVDELASRLATMEALVLIRERTAVRSQLLEKLPALRLISQRSVYPHIDVAACTRLGIVVASDLHPGVPSYATAELTWGLILAASRHIPEQAGALRAGRWQTRVGHTLRDKTLGVLGYGRIGAVVARYGEAFGMRVVIWGGEGSRARAADDGVEVAASKGELFERSDVVSVHLRLVDATRAVIGPEDLALMPPSAMFVNTSRAALVAPGALTEALRLGRPGWVAVDVYEDEPLFEATNELVTMDRALCTPHLGYVTMEEWELQFGEVFAQVNAFDSGTPTNVVNPEVLTNAALRRRGPMP